LQKFLTPCLNNFKFKLFGFCQVEIALELVKKKRNHFLCSLSNNHAKLVLQVLTIFGWNILSFWSNAIFTPRGFTNSNLYLWSWVGVCDFKIFNLISLKIRKPWHSYLHYIQNKLFSYSSTLNLFAEFYLLPTRNNNASYMLSYDTKVFLWLKEISNFHLENITALQKSDTFVKMK